MTAGSDAHRRGRAFGDADAMVEHDDMVGDAHHHAHVVLDQENRHVVIAPDVEQQAPSALGFRAD